MKYSRRTTPITSVGIDIARDNFPPKGENGKNITVFCAAALPKRPIYGRHALELGRLIGDRGHNLVWGATDAGTMKIVSEAAKSRGAKLLGVGFAGSNDSKKGGLTNADVLFGASSIAERKNAMLNLGDLAIALAGGIGTLDEIATMLERKKIFDPMPPIILLNSNNFYSGLTRQVEVMEQEGFMFDRASDMIRIASTPQEAIQLAETLKPIDWSSLLEGPPRGDQ